MRFYFVQKPIFMASQLRGNDLRNLGFPEGRAIGLALAQLQRKHLKKWVVV